MSDKVRELERKANLYSDRLKEYDEIFNKVDEENDRKDALVR